MARPLTAILRTRRLTMRPPTSADLPFVTDLFGRPSVVAHRPDPRPETESESVATLERILKHWRLHGFGRWILERDGKAIGLAGITHRDAFAGLNLSYHLHPDAWGHGYAVEAAGEAVRVAFCDLKAERVIGLVRSKNPASARVLERLAFAREGEVMLGGAPTDLWIRRATVDAPGGLQAGGPCR